MSTSNKEESRPGFRTVPPTESYCLDVGVPKYLARRAPVASTNDQHLCPLPFLCRLGSLERHWHVCNHLVVPSFVRDACLQKLVQHEHPAKVWTVKHLKHSSYDLAGTFCG